MAKQADIAFIQEFYSHDRPLSFWTYQLTLPILGTNPQVWQLFSLLVRALCAWLVWNVLLTLWPTRKFAATGAALLFLVYPSFTQQNISVAYSQHFISLSLFFLSVWAMLRSLKAKQPTGWIVVSLFTQVIHLVTLEYFAGLELLRPMMLYFHERGLGAESRIAWKTAVKRWLPYAVGLFIFVVWRVFFLSLPDDPNNPKLLGDLWANFPITLLGFIERSLQDFVHVAVGPWENTLYSELIDFSNLSRVVSIVLALAIGLVTSQYLRHALRKGTRGSKDHLWGAQVVKLGFAAIFLGMLPVRIADRDVLTGLFADRFTLPALFGAALLWVGFAQLLMKRALHGALLVGLLVGLSAGFHFRTANTYGWDWTRQQRIYWQLVWRIPSLPSGVALVGEGALSAFTSEYAAAAAINTLYRAPIRTGLTPLWVLDFYDDFDIVNDSISAKNPVHELRNLRFEIDEQRLILFDYSTPGQCLWILDSGDEWNLDVEPQMRENVASSSIELIDPIPGPPPFSDVFGSPPPLDWCFYFQKIELAAQFGDWEKAIGLWREATEQDFSPNNQYEMLPVIEAFARTGDIEQAIVLSLDAIRKQQNVKMAVCVLWDALSDPSDDLLAVLDC